MVGRQISPVRESDRSLSLLALWPGSGSFRVPSPLLHAGRRTRRLFHTWVAVGCALGPALTPPCLPLLQRWPWKVTRAWLGGSQDRRSLRTREKGTNTFCDPLSRVRGTNRALANLTPAHREGNNRGGGRVAGPSSA